MKYSHLAALAALSLAAAACSDLGTQPQTRQPGDRDNVIVCTLGDPETIFTSEVPASTLDASPGWEVSTQFTPQVQGRIVGYRFYKASGETGTHTARLWNSSGTKVDSATFTSESSSGWQSVSKTGPLVSAGSTYRVSVNTNAYQVKTFGFFSSGPLYSSLGNLVADFAYYGQPTGARPTSGSYSAFFVDVIFRERICEDVQP